MCFAEFCCKGEGLCSGLAVRGSGLGENLVKQCYVGVHIADNSNPAIR